MDPYRLPRTVVPSLYELRLEPDLEAGTFAGRVAITASVREATPEVVLNAIELSIEEAAAEVGGQRWPAEVKLEEETERCHLRFPNPLPTGEVRLHLTFRGTLNDKLRGFYRSRYRAADGTSRTLAATQFEATDARRAFPCWDEPAFKAAFRTTLVVPADLQVVSNTAVAEESSAGGKRVVRFADTIPMSTYLVAFVVGELEASDAVMVGKTPLRVWCVPGKKRLSGFGREIAAFSLGYFEEYYGIPYPSDKLDLLAIPDFAAGAMENLGAITFRETALLVDESAATHQEKERVADVVAHENAHMWFGDLVTMSWWNGLWLNEAFATFMEMKAVDAWKPAWQRWTTFGVSRSAALLVDGLRSTRPIEYPVAAPSDADAMFDVLTYEKGASVLRMLEQYIGEPGFRAGVRDYLQKHAYANTETADLWSALGSANNLDVGAMMEGWVFHPGYPLVSASRAGDTLILTQQRFRYLPEEEKVGIPAQEVWQVPVQMRALVEGEWREQRLLLHEAEGVLVLPPKCEAVLVNSGGHGFYRVRYESDLLEALVSHLGQLSAIERFNLVNDTWAGVLAGLVSLSSYLLFTSNFTGERDRNVWQVLLGSFHTLNRLVEDADRPLLAQLVRARLASALAELGWSARAGEDELTAQLRGDLLRAAGTLGDDPDVQKRAEEVYRAGPSQETDAAVLAAAIAVLAQTGGTERYEEFLGRYRSAGTPQEEQRFLYALVGFRSAELVGRTLTLALDGTMRTQDAPYVVRSLLYAPHARAQAWDFFRSRWDDMSKAYPPVALRRMCEGVVGLARPEWEQQVQTFFREKNINLGGKTLEQYLEQLHIAVLLRQREGAGLREALARE